MSTSKIESMCRPFIQQIFTECLLSSGHCFNVKDATGNKLDEASAVLELTFSGAEIEY